MIVSENRRKPPETPGEEAWEGRGVVWKEEAGNREAEKKSRMFNKVLIPTGRPPFFPPLPQPQFPSDGKEDSPEFGEAELQ